MQVLRLTFRTGGQSIYEISIIDFLREVAKVEDYSYKPLVDFYIAYYDANMKKDGVEYIRKMRNELMALTKQRNKLDERIRELTSKIEMIKRGNVSNERR